MPPGRGQSEMVGVLSVLVLVIALVVILGTGFLSGIDTSSEPLLDAELAADATDVTITHLGGDSIDASELTVVLRDGRGNVTRFSVASVSPFGDADGRFDPTETVTHAHGFDSAVVEVLIVHGPSNAALVDETVDVESAGGGARAVNEAPDANLSYAPSSPLVGQPITFDASDSTDVDGTITSYEWDWTGDGTYDDTGATVDHSYGGSGTYSVTLRVTDEHGATDTVTDTVTVNAPPDANLSYSPSDPSPGQSITFDASDSTDVDGTITSYEWDFDDDGATDATGPTASHTYLTPGDHTVTLRVTDDDGATDSVTETVTVEVSVPNQDPTALFTWDRESFFSNTGDLDASSSFDTDGTITSYEWDFDGDGETDATGRTVEDVTLSSHPDHRYFARVSLTVEDDDGATSTVERWVFVWP